MTTPRNYHYQPERVDIALQAHMVSTAQAIQIIETRRRAIYGALDYPPPLDLALDALTNVVDLAKILGGHTPEMVAVARHAGATWSQIGKVLGVSRQAAHEHFHGPPTIPRPRSPHATGG